MPEKLQSTKQVHGDKRELSSPARGQVPFWLEGAVRSSRRGQFWVPGERVTVDEHSYQHGPMFVCWEAPEKVAKPYPLVLIHGGAMQGTEWLDTPDGRPGWAQRFVEAGYAVFIVDRPTQGRSPFSPEIMGKIGPAFAYEEGEEVFFPKKTLDEHTQWLFPADDTEAFDSFIAAFGPLPEDIKVWQKLDQDRLAKLLDMIGPVVLVTHSASGSDGWLVADRRPDLVAAIITIEPMGPPFGKTPNIGALDWGLTAIPVNYAPPRETPEEVRAADPATLCIPALRGMPVAVVSGEVSPQSKYAPEMVEFLKHAGAAVDALHLPDLGIHGNGHGLIYEKNSDQTIQPVLEWLDRKLKATED